jgi:hypothetical protein
MGSRACYPNQMPAAAYRRLLHGSPDKRARSCTHTSGDPATLALDRLTRDATARYGQDGNRVESAPADSRTVLILYARSHTALTLSVS